MRLASDAEQFARVTAFSIRTEQPLQIIFLAYSSTIVFKLAYALFYQFYDKISIFSIKKCSDRLLYTTS